MAKIAWKYSYKSSLPNAKTYYRGGTQGGAIGLQLQFFVNNHLSRVRGQVVRGMMAVEKNAKRDVINKARIDTGALKRQVFSTGDYGTQILKTRFGWRELAPYYAPFQEFGTRKGIKPMFAVHTAYRNALPQVRKVVNGR